MKIHPFLGSYFERNFAEHPVVIYDGGAAGGPYDPFQDLTSGCVSVVGFEPVHESVDSKTSRPHWGKGPVSP